MRNCFCFRSSFDAASSCRPRRWAYGHLKLQEKNKVRLSVPPAVSRQSSPSRRAYPVVGEGLRHCRPLIRGCRRRLLIAGPLCFLVVFIFFLLSSYFPPLDWRKHSSYSAGVVAHNTMHLDLLRSFFLRCLSSRSPPLASPLPVRVRPLDLSEGREDCCRCRRRILTTS